jgi:hypothetical protein
MHDISFNFEMYLDLLLHILDGIAGLNLECDGLSCESLYEDLHLVETDTTLNEFERKSKSIFGNSRSQKSDGIDFITNCTLNLL